MDVSTAGSKFVVYIGTYTGSGSEGIYAFDFDADTGELRPLGLAAESVNPSFLALDGIGKHVYAVNEIGEFRGKPTGAVSAFAIDPGTHRLRALGQVASAGTGPAHLSLDDSGRHVLVANYGGGSVATLPVLENGGLGEAVSTVQHKDSSGAKPPRVPHAHSILASPDNRFAVVADLGLDQVFVYKFDAASGKLTPGSSTASATGHGPRHFKFHPNGRFAYVTNELHSSLTAYSYDAAKGTLTPVQTISMKPDDFKDKNDAAEVQVHPSGKFLYASNRGHDSIAVFAIDNETGTLTLIDRTPTGGKTPRHFSLDPTGRWLIVANQDSNNLTVFGVDQKTGCLVSTSKSYPLAAPVCVMFVEGSRSE